MATLFDVATYILDERGSMTAMKLQKLLYYCQAWALVWDEEPLFDDEFEAWANGPVIRRLYERHRGKFKVDSELFDSGKPIQLSATEQETIDEVLDFYGDKNAQWLSNLTHKESPWLDARGDIDPMDSSEEIISKASMHEYYSSL